MWWPWSTPASSATCPSACLRSRTRSAGLSPIAAHSRRPWMRYARKESPSIWSELALQPAVRPLDHTEAKSEAIVWLLQLVAYEGIGAATQCAHPAVGRVDVQEDLGAWHEIDGVQGPEEIVVAHVQRRELEGGPPGHP